jgi:hypothetical protein
MRLDDLGKSTTLESNKSHQQRGYYQGDNVTVISADISCGLRDSIPRPSLVLTCGNEGLYSQAQPWPAAWH